jgi:hypothetical protein
MPTIIDGSGSATFQTPLPLAQGGNGNTTGNVVSSQIVDALNATGSAPLYACRAWVNFNGTGTVAIRASGNVSSITDNGAGNYTVNFTNSMVDANYSAIADTNGNGHINTSWVAHAMFSSAHSTTVTPTTSNFRFCTFHPVNLVNQDTTFNLVSIFR